MNSTNFTDTEVKALYIVVDSGTSILFICFLFLFLIYIRRPKWTIHMTTNTLLSLFFLLHCILTCIPVYNESTVFCRFSGSLHESSLIMMSTFTDYIVVFAYLTFEKAELIHRLRWFFVHTLISLFMLIFISCSIWFYFNGEIQLKGNLHDCRIEGYTIKWFIIIYCALT